MFIIIDNCPSNWIADGYCDIACNTSACDFDGGDCKNATGGGIFFLSLLLLLAFFPPRLLFPSFPFLFLLSFPSSLLSFSFLLLLYIFPSFFSALGNSNMTAQQPWWWEDSNKNAPNFDKYCSKGCPDSWVGDKYCDRACKTADCGMDGGDCGLNEVFANVPGYVLLYVPPPFVVVFSVCLSCWFVCCFCFHLYVYYI